MFKLTNNFAKKSVVKKTKPRSWPEDDIIDFAEEVQSVGDIFWEKLREIISNNEKRRNILSVERDVEVFQYFLSGIKTKFIAKKFGISHFVVTDVTKNLKKYAEQALSECGNI